MNINEFTARKSTVISANPTDTGTEIWARDEDGRETAYVVNDFQFRAREGQALTAIHHGCHPVALRNDTAKTKIQLLTGEDLLGSGPQVTLHSTKFWIAWVILAAFLGPYVIGIGQMIVDGIFEQHPFIQWLGDVFATLLYVGLVLGVPYWLIIHPRILRSKHNRRVKQADAAIAKLFAPF